jgi:glycosyltransferase involved in cell wall biosynthesis
MEIFTPSTHPTLERKGFHVGMVSVLRRDKGHRYFLEAIPMILKEIPGAAFSIAGDGPQLRNIEEQIRELSLEGKVSLLGHREDVPGIMASLDVLVHPSSGHEGLAQSILQALAMERPVVATDIGAISEVVIDNISGLLIQPCSAEQIAEKVLEIYRNPELGRQMGKEGKRLVAAKHSADHMLNEIEALYRKLQKTP